MIGFFLHRLTVMVHLKHLRDEFILVLEDMRAEQRRFVELLQI